MTILRLVYISISVSLTLASTTTEIASESSLVISEMSTLFLQPQSAEDPQEQYWGENYMITYHGSDEAFYFGNTLRAVFSDIVSHQHEEALLNAFIEFKRIQSPQLAEHMTEYMPSLNAAKRSREPISQMEPFVPFETLISAVEMLAFELRKPSGSRTKIDAVLYILRNSEALDDEFIWVDDFCMRDRVDVVCLKCGIALPTMVVLRAIAEVTDSGAIREYVSRMASHSHKVSQVWELIDALTVTSRVVTEYIEGRASEDDIHSGITDALFLVKVAEEEMSDK